MWLKVVNPIADTANNNFKIQYGLKKELIKLVLGIHSQYKLF
jgi:hypothetical protein